MIDFMVNIKNKKDMTKCNIKTFVATSVLCVFFNGILIYGMKDKEKEKENEPIGETQEPEINEAADNKNTTKFININNENLYKPSQNNSTFNLENNRTDVIPQKNLSINKREEIDMSEYGYDIFGDKNSDTYISNNKNFKDLEKLEIEEEEKIENSALYNYKGEFSILFCCNWLNDKLKKRQRYLIAHPVSRNERTNYAIQEIILKKIGKEGKGKNECETKEEQGTTEKNIQLFEDDINNEQILNKFKNISNNINNDKIKNKLYDNLEKTKENQNQEKNNNNEENINSNDEKS